MKKILLLVLILSSGAAFSQIQNNLDRKEIISKNVQEFRDKMAKELNLTPEQVKQISAIDDKYKSQEDAIRKQVNNLREQSYQIRKQKKAEVDKVLTDEQKQKLNDMKYRFHNRRK